jgi:Histidine kinase
MSAIFPSLTLRLDSARSVPGPGTWLRSQPESVAMAGLLAFAAPVTFFVGAFSVMREPTAGHLIRLMLWWLLYGLELWALLLVAGFGDQRLGHRCGRVTRGTVWLLVACATAVVVTLSTAGRADLLAGQGVVQSSLTMHLHAAVFSFTMVLLFLAHLRRSHSRAAATARLVAAQAAQREARADIARARLAAVQARIDPQLLFGMLEAVRAAYRVDAARAERLLDELIAFLRAALPALRAGSSSVAHEAALAQACARLHALAGAGDASLSVEVSAEAMHARFPPGVLLPLLDDALRARAGVCRLSSSRQADSCCVMLALPQAPSQVALSRVKSLLADLYGASARLTLDAADPAAHGGTLRYLRANGIVSDREGHTVMVQIPYELA